MAHGIPLVFEGVVEIDETDSGGSWRNKPKTVCAKGVKGIETQLNELCSAFYGAMVKGVMQMA